MSDSERTKKTAITATNGNASASRARRRVNDAAQCVRPRKDKRGVDLISDVERT